MNESLADLEAIYGPSARWSEHKRGDHITYTSAEGLRTSGTIVWVQARFGDIPMKYVVAPDVPTGIVDFVIPGDILQIESAYPITQRLWIASQRVTPSLAIALLQPPGKQWQKYPRCNGVDCMETIGTM